jgi:predicted DNA-binding protein (MmcQ/YjbR family)
MSANERELAPAEVFLAVQSHCMAKEGAVEDYPWEDVGWKIKGKLFCIGSKDHNVFTVKSTTDKQQALIQHPRISVAAYVGRYGWVTVDIVDRADCELALELIDESYDLIAKKKKR